MDEQKEAARRQVREAQKALDKAIDAALLAKLPIAMHVMNAAVVGSPQKRPFLSIILNNDANWD